MQAINNFNIKDFSGVWGRYFAGDIIEAAKSDKSFDKINAAEISRYHNVSLNIVKEEIIFVRKNLKRIVGEGY